MGDIPLMRAGFALMAVIAAVGGLSLVVLPEENRDGDRKKDKDRNRAEAQAPAVPPGPLAAVLPPGDSTAVPADSATAFACRVDGASVNLPNNLRESSGLALAAGGDALWTHNDSRKGVLHLVGLDGSVRAEMPVTGAAFEDWEDIAAGPCPGGQCLYLADIGDNDGRRRNITIYRMPEPSAGATQTAPAEALRATYPDGAQDAEALFVLSDGAVYVVTKGETRGIAIYQLPRGASPGTTSLLELKVQLAGERQDRPERITGAAASPDGQWLALRTTAQLRFYRTGDLASRQLSAPLTFDLGPLKEPQGEGVEFGPAGSGAVFLSSEAGDKNNGRPTLSRLTCTLPSS